MLRPIQPFLRTSLQSTCTRFLRTAYRKFRARAYYRTDSLQRVHTARQGAAGDTREVDAEPRAHAVWGVAAEMCSLQMTHCVRANTPQAPYPVSARRGNVHGIDTNMHSGERRADRITASIVFGCTFPHADTTSPVSLWTTTWSCITRQQRSVWIAYRYKSACERCERSV